MIRALRLAAVAGCLLVGVCAVRAEPDARARAAAQQAFQRGKSLYQAQDYVAALAAFRGGFQRYPLRGFLVNIGQCHRRLNQFEEAAAAYRQFLASEGASAALRREVEDALAEVETHLVDKRPPAPVREPDDPPPPVVEPPTAPAVERTPEEPARATVETNPLVAVVPPPRPAHRRRWLWAVVGAGIGLVVVGAVTVGAVLGTRGPSEPTGGSLGLIDGRMR